MLLILDHEQEPYFRDSCSPLKEARLNADLEAIVKGLEPTSATLEVAPLLRHWWQATSPWFRHFVLLGKVIQHPELGSGEIHTSALRAIALDLSWARASSRWYRLERPRLVNT